MISEEKMTHIIHLMLDGIEKAGLAKFSNKPTAIHEAKRLGFRLITHFNQADEIARKRISSQKSPPPEHSPQWDNLYQKYLDEEMAKVGG